MTSKQSKFCKRIDIPLTLKRIVRRLIGLEVLLTSQVLEHLVLIPLKHSGRKEAVNIILLRSLDKEE